MNFLRMGGETEESHQDEAGKQGCFLLNSVFALNEAAAGVHASSVEQRLMVCLGSAVM